MDLLKNIRDNKNFIAFKWSAVLFAVGAVYIFGTDTLLGRYFDQFSIYRSIQTYKGLLFLGIIALVLFLTIRHLMTKIDVHQQEVKKEKRFADRIQNSLPGIFFVLDEKGRLIRWNNDTNIISGLSDKELMHLNAIERVEECDQAKAEEALREVREKGETETKIFIKTRSELKRLYKITASRFNNDGHDFIVGTGIDITQENELKKELAYVLDQERERRKKIEVDIKNLKDTFDQTPSPRCILEGPDHKFVYANDAYKKVVGTNALIDKNVIEVIPEVEEQGYIDILDNVYKTGEPYIDREKTVWINDGAGGSKEFIFNLIYVPVKNDGKVHGIYCEGIEITDQIRANERVKRQNYQLKAAQEIAQLGYWESNLDTGEITWSDIIYKLFGLDQEKVTPSIDMMMDLVHPDDQSIFEKNFEKLKRGENFESEYRIEKPDGEIRWFKEIGEIFDWKDGDPLKLHGVVLDITDQKNQEKKIKRSYLQGENKERKRISKELHDGIAQYLSAAILHLDNTGEILKDEKGADQLRYARDLVKKAVSETRSISQNLMPQTIDKHGIISAVKLLIKQYKLSSNIDFNFTYDNESEWTVNKEVETNLYRIMQEVISNAVRHSGCDTIWLEIKKSPEEIRCKIRDNGSGLDMKNISIRKGIGLQSIKDRVELLQGTIEINNVSNKGLAVSVVIPIT